MDMKRIGFGLAALLALALGISGGARAATINFNGSAAVSGCTISSTASPARTTYTCAQVPPANALYLDQYTIADGVTVVSSGAVAFGFNQGLKMSGSAALTATGDLNIGDINPLNLAISGGTLTATGATFKMGAQAQTIVANIVGKDLNIGTGSTTKVTGSLTASGTITLASYSTVIGPLDANIVTTSSPVTITGAVSVDTSFVLASGSTLNGNLDAGGAGTVNINAANATVNGNVTGAKSLTMGSSTTISGNVQATTVLLQASSAYIGGNATVAAIQLDWMGRVDGTIYCTGSTSGSCSCVTNYSGYYFGSNAPSCAAPPVSGPDHIEIAYSGSALTCEAPTVTVKACANAACSTLYKGGATVTLSPGGGKVTLGATGSGTGTVQQSAAGTATLSAVSSPAAANKLQCIKNGASDTSCTMAFANAGFLLEAGAKVAGTPNDSFKLRAVKKADSSNVCVPFFQGKPKTFDFSCGYGNPTTGTLPLSVGDKALNCTSGASSSVAVTFDGNGIATPALAYADAGQMNLTARYKPASGAEDYGIDMDGTGSIVFRPASFEVATTANLRAGVPFDVTVTAKNAAIKSVATPNFGRETTAQVLALTKTLTAPRMTAPGTAVYGGSTADPELGGTLSSTVKDGAVKISGVTWAEAGVLTLNADLAAAPGYLSSGAGVTGSLTGVTFLPHHFDTVLVLATGAPPMACVDPLKCAGGRFVYSSQPFSVTVQAKNAAGNLTLNYGGRESGGVVDTYVVKPAALSAWDSAAGTAANPPATAGVLSPATVADSAFVKGSAVATISYALQASGATLATPTDVRLRAIDTSNVISSSGQTEASLTVLNGRMQFPTTFGSELLALPIRPVVQYLNANNIWILNTSDSVSPLANTTMSNCIAKANTTSKLCAVDGSGTYLNLNLSAKATVTQGVGQLRIAAPGAGNVGSVDLVVKPALVYLPSNTGRVVFGVYRSGPVIYRRELY